MFKLGDLGLTTQIALQGDPAAQIARGSAFDQEDIEGDSRYLSREALQHLESCDLKQVDIFACGASLYELALGERLPPDGPGWVDLREGRFRQLEGFSAPFGLMCQALMHPDPGARPTAAAIMCDPYLCRVEEIDALQNQCGLLAKELAEKRDIEVLQERKLEQFREEVERLRQQLQGRLAPGMIEAPRPPPFKASQTPKPLL